MRERERMKLYQSLYRSWVLRLMEENGAARLGSHIPVESRISREWGNRENYT